VPVRRNARWPFHQRLRWLPAPSSRRLCGWRCPPGQDRILAHRVPFSAWAQAANHRRQRGPSALFTQPRQRRVFGGRDQHGCRPPADSSRAGASVRNHACGCFRLNEPTWEAISAALATAARSPAAPRRPGLGISPRSPTDGFRGYKSPGTKSRSRSRRSRSRVLPAGQSGRCAQR
jgi:hypothetical protein